MKLKRSSLRISETNINISSYATIQAQPQDDRNPQVYEEVNWNTVKMLDLRKLKEVMILYVLQLSR